MQNLGTWPHAEERSSDQIFSTDWIALRPSLKNLRQTPMHSRKCLQNTSWTAAPETSIVGSPINCTDEASSYPLPFRGPTTRRFVTYQGIVEAYPERLPLKNLTIADSSG